MSDNILEPKINSLPPITDWQKVFLILQQANEAFLRGATLQEFGKQVIGDVSIQGADFEDLPVADSTTPVELPIPEAERKFGFLANGTFTQPNGPDLIYTSTQWGLTLFDGDKWVKRFTFELPVDPNSLKRSDLGVTGGAAEYDILNSVSGASNNYADTSKVVSGYVNNSNGNITDSDNWIRLPYENIPENLKGKKVTISNYGTISALANIVSFRDSLGTYMASDSVAGQGGGAATKITITIPLTAKQWAFTIANDASSGGIGTRPTNNIYTKTYIINEGETALPWEPFGTVVKVAKLDNSNAIKFSNPVTETGEGAVPAKEVFKISNKIDSVVVASSNLIDTSKDVERGNYSSVNGNPVGSDNWIRFKKKNFSTEVLTKLANGEDVYITLSGGGTVASGASVIVFYDVNGGIASHIAGTGSTTFPKTIKLQNGWTAFAGTIANEIGIGIGIKPTNNTFTNSFMVNYGQTVLPYQPAGYVINAKSIPPPSNKYNTSEIVVTKVNDTTLQIFFHIGGANDIWFRINLIRSVNSEKFIDVWKLDRGYTVKRVDDSFINVKEIVATGVYENAIYTNGAGYTNALGSTHGWEVIESFEMYMDGKPLQLSSLTTVKGTNFTFTTKTNLKTVDGSGNIGVSNKKWEFKNGVFKINNFIKWLGVLDVSSNSYIGMLSVLRVNDASQQVTHTGMSNEDLTPQDISVPGFTTPIYSNGNDFRRNTLIAWGDDFKAEMTANKRRLIKADGTVVDNLPGAGMYIQNTDLYNKFYNRFGAVIVQIGDCFDVEIEYKLSNI